MRQLYKRIYSSDMEKLRENSLRASYRKKSYVLHDIKYIEFFSLIYIVNYSQWFVYKLFIVHYDFLNYCTQ